MLLLVNITNNLQISNFNGQFSDFILLFTFSEYLHSHCLLLKAFTQLIIDFSLKHLFSTSSRTLHLTDFSPTFVANFFFMFILPIPPHFLNSKIGGSQ